MFSKFGQQPRLLRGYINLYTTAAASYQMADDSQLMGLFESRLKYDSAKHHISTVSLLYHRVMPTLQSPGNADYARKYKSVILKKHAKRLESEIPLYNAYELLACLEAVSQFDTQWQLTKVAMERFTELLILDRRDTQLGFMNINGKVKVIRKYVETHTFTRIIEYIMTRPIVQLMRANNGVGEELAQECWEYIRQEAANFSYEDCARTINSMLELSPRAGVYMDFLQNRVLGQCFGNCSTFVHALNLVATLEQKYTEEEEYEKLKMFQGLYDYFASQLPYLVDWTAIDDLSFIPVTACSLARTTCKVSPNIWDLLIQGFCRFNSAYPHGEVCRFLESLLLKGVSKKELGLVLQSYTKYSKIYKKLNIIEKTHYMFIFANLKKLGYLEISPAIINDFRKEIREKSTGFNSPLIPNKLVSILRVFPEWKPDFKKMEDYFEDVYAHIRKRPNAQKEIHLMKIHMANELNDPTKWTHLTPRENEKRKKEAELLIEYTSQKVQKTQNPEKRAKEEKTLKSEKVETTTEKTEKTNKGDIK